MGGEDKGPRRSGVFWVGRVDGWLKTSGLTIEPSVVDVSTRSNRRLTSTMLDPENVSKGVEIPSLTLQFSLSFQFSGSPDPLIRFPLSSFCRYRYFLYFR